MAKKRLNKKRFLLSTLLIILILIMLISRFEKPIFTEDSIDNPNFKNKPQETRPILIEGNSSVGVILLHGVGATTWETKKLAQYLNKRNITTYQVLLEGHGNSIYDLEQSDAEKWYQSAEEALSQLHKQKSFIIGSSIGSLLALELSINKELDGIILFSVPITFNDKRIKYTPFLKYFKRFHHREIEEEHKEFYHENFPLKTLAEMISYINKVKALMPEVTAPTLIIQSKNDPRLESKSAQYTYDNIASEKKEIMWLNSKKHVLMIEYADEDKEFKNERDLAFEKVYDFIINNSK